MLLKHLFVSQFGSTYFYLSVELAEFKRSADSNLLDMVDFVYQGYAIVSEGNKLYFSLSLRQTFQIFKCQDY